MFSQLLVTGHRGLGVTAKRRDLLIKEATFYPENSLAAFEQAIVEGADALECDIHVSKDFVPMVIHGNKITDYAYYVRKEKGRFERDEKKKINKYTADELQKYFHLKTFEGMEGEISTLVNEKRSKIFQKNKLIRKLAQTSNLDSNQLIEIQKEKAKILDHIAEIDHKILQLEEKYDTAVDSCDPKWLHIPTLTELLELVAFENFAREGQNKTPLLLNIELKGEDSGFVTLTTIAKYNRGAEKNGYPQINLAHIVLLGRVAVGEIVTAKGFICGSMNFLQKTAAWSKKDYKSKNRHELFNKLFCTEDRNFILKQTEGELKQNQEPGKIVSRIVAYQRLQNKENNSLSELALLRNFLIDLGDMQAIKTNVMLTTTDLYGKNSLVPGDQDFEVLPEIKNISAGGENLIRYCLIQGYNGIDISLFDFEESCIKVLEEFKDEYYLEKNMVVGVTASNWKGVVSEKSPVLPSEATLKAYQISSRLEIPVLMKVDEPKLFSELKRCLDLGEGFQESELEVVEDILDFGFQNFEALPNKPLTLGRTPSQSLLTLSKLNYDISPCSPDLIFSPVLTRSEKPPRDTVKKAFTI